MKQWFATFFIATFSAMACADQSPPNVILIMADDLGYGDISPYDGWIETPNLAALARVGLRFTDFHSSGNVCSPTRAGLLTGRYQQRAGLSEVLFANPRRDEHYHGMQDVEWTLAEAFQEAGYATAMYGKWHLGYLPKFNPVRHGFDQFRGFVSGNVDYVSHVDQVGRHDWWVDSERKDEPGYPRDGFTIAKGLKAAGYTTGIMGKWHLTYGRDGGYMGLNPEYAHLYGFDYAGPVLSRDEFQDGGDRGVNTLTDQASEFISHSRDQPWFCFLSHHMIHSDVVAPDDIAQEYRDRGYGDVGPNRAIYLAGLDIIDRFGGPN